MRPCVVDNLLPSGCLACSVQPVMIEMESDIAIMSDVFIICLSIRSYLGEGLAESICGKEVDFCFGILPCSWGQACFVGAAVSEKFFGAPAGFSGDLGEETAALIAVYNVDSVDSEAKAHGIVGFCHW